MQDLQALQLGQIEQLTGVLVDGRAATAHSLRQNAKMLEDVFNRLDEVSKRVEEDSKRLDTLEKLVLRVLEDLVVIRKKLDVPRMGIAADSKNGD